LNRLRQQKPNDLLADSLPFVYSTTSFGNEIVSAIKWKNFPKVRISSFLTGRHISQFTLLTTAAQNLFV
jgi:hypothetical protein